MNPYTIFDFLQDAVNVASITAEVTVLFAVVPLWRKRRLNFAFSLLCSSSLGLLLIVFQQMSHAFFMHGLVYEAVWGAWWTLAAISMFLYATAIVQMARHFPGKPASMPGRAGSLPSSGP